jgi:hypothetical protein
MVTSEERSPSLSMCACVYAALINDKVRHSPNQPGSIRQSAKSKPRLALLCSCCCAHVATTWKDMAFCFLMLGCTSCRHTSILRVRCDPEPSSEVRLRSIVYVTSSETKETKEMKRSLSVSSSFSLRNSSKLPKLFSPLFSGLSRCHHRFFLPFFLLFFVFLALCWLVRC